MEVPASCCGDIFFQREEEFRSKHFYILEWLSQSPDVNTTESVADIQRHSSFNLSEFELLCRNQWRSLKCAEHIKYPQNTFENIRMLKIFCYTQSYQKIRRGLQTILQKKNKFNQ
ncbi:hypothetical protein GOODEAATRI_019000 [Goodea atripinnis]|uniref:Uncharacterized protein n=1 Tax=Goodea atripinnis TaxID=208336 RepID=A0ABV0N2L5_9TELE